MYCVQEVPLRKEKYMRASLLEGARGAELKELARPVAS